LCQKPVRQNRISGIPRGDIPVGAGPMARSSTNRSLTDWPGYAGTAPVLHNGSFVDREFKGSSQFELFQSTVVVGSHHIDNQIMEETKVAAGRGKKETRISHLQ